ncbi:m-AAA protease-interacting protein 1, mitochondrial [Corythoichthys intestinalis]|uniref:m-AAA protease-interacting protein 1, mitochondrial n=1 Tax=Corythoichthys intestinalis TaxID=161448 RepID=UPI0025A5A3C6|nr:m-AAA protease-interacting protein 1, mitochondrial [Corythoichthys intestinalis]
MLRITRLATCGGLAVYSAGMCGRRSGLTLPRCPARAFYRQMPGYRTHDFTRLRTFCSQSRGDVPEGGNSDRKADVSVVGIPDPITWIRCNVHLFLVDLYYDLGVNSKDFERGVKQAFVHISSVMSQGKYFELIGMVSVEMIRYMEERCRPLSERHRQNLAVSMEDIILVLPEEVSVDFVQGRKFCTIAMRLWYLTTPDGPDDPEAVKIFRVAPGADGFPPKRVATAVYEFHCEIIKGGSEDWIVTTVWHWNWNAND